MIGTGGRIVTVVVRYGGKERIFGGISEEDVRMKIQGYLERCNYQRERGPGSGDGPGTIRIV